MAGSTIYTWWWWYTNIFGYISKTKVQYQNRRTLQPFMGGRKEKMKGNHADAK